MVSVKVRETKPELVTPCMKVAGMPLAVLLASRTFPEMVREEVTRGRFWVAKAPEETVTCACVPALKT